MSNSQKDSVEVPMASTETLKTSQLPKHSPIDLTFKNLVYSVEVPDQDSKHTFWGKSYVRKELLRGVSGVLRAGKVTTIMGCSGAGKTTLLNTLAWRVPR